jgi:hypothetical protein
MESEADNVTETSANNSLNVTPPGSPTGGKPAAKKRPSLRGANRTKKTEQAINRILVSAQAKDQQPPFKATRHRRGGASKAARGRQSRLWERAECVSEIVEETNNSSNSGSSSSSSSFNVKIRFRGEIHRLAVTPSERLGPLADRFGAEIGGGLAPGRLAFESEGNRLGRDVTVAAAGLSIVSILQAR